MRLAPLTASLRSGELTPLAHLEDVLRRMDDLDGGPWDNLVASRDDERAQGDAALATIELRSGRWRGPLHGVAVAVKDNIDVEGMPTRLGSDSGPSSPAERDAAITAQLRAAGAVIVAKTHLHELAYGSTGAVNSAGPARNPHDPARITGGSSSGSAALIALGVLAVAIGTDTGCSVRTPAALCGVVGLMPGLGSFSTRGVVPVSTTLDHVGLLTADPDSADLTYRSLVPSATPPGPLPDISSVRGLRIGLPRGHAFAVHDPAISAAVDACTTALRDAGAVLVEVEVPDLARLADSYPLVVGSEVHVTHANILEHRPSTLQAATAARLRQQSRRSAYHYLQAVRQMMSARDSVLRELRHIRKLDCLMLATTPIRATALTAERVAGENVAASLLRLCVPFSVLGVPAVSVPAPATVGLPIGVQIVGIRATETDVLSLARIVNSLG